MVMNVSCACATAALPANSAATERPSAVDLTSVSFIGPSLPFFKPVKLSLRQRIAAVDRGCARPLSPREPVGGDRGSRSEEHTSELQSLMRISYTVYCLTKKKNQNF